LRAVVLRISSASWLLEFRVLLFFRGSTPSPRGRAQRGGGATPWGGMRRREQSARSGRARGALLAGCAAALALASACSPSPPPADPALKLRGELPAAIAAWRRGCDERFEAWAKERELPARGARLHVEIVASSAQDVAAVRRLVAALGGEVTADFENRVWGYVPASALQSLAEAPEVFMLQLARADVRPAAVQEER
jgi:hypothetical protein